ncbi:papilin-like isoform X2 [Lineus longissimus]|uniref:papilin-like isoform X2 n=1 Tax=Lineus longissimus TaxID=88925 RepID=UPI00315D085E
MKTPIIFLCLLAVGLWTRCDGQIQKKCKRDLVFIVDSSGSINDAEYGDMIKFMVNVVKDGGAIGMDEVRVGVIIFASYRHSRIALHLKDQNTDIVKLIAFIETIERLSRGQTTHTYWTLTNLLPKSYLAANGGREGVQKMAILMTDGGSKDSKYFKESGLASIEKAEVRMYVVGIGDKVDKQELLDIAGSSSRVFLAGSYSKLAAIANPVHKDLNCVTTPVCSQPKVVGPCKDKHMRYYYDAGTNNCIFFIYGGCDGNANNFKTRRACEKHCKKPCPLRCKAGYVCKWQQRFCIKAPCNPPGKHECIAICKMPKLPGPCKGSMNRYHYNPKTDSCQRFTYGGCLGNENNFRTKAACEKLCVTTPVCSQPKVVGPCKGFFPRLYYDARTNTCRFFIYGGCGGNANNFKTRRACVKRCKKRCTIKCKAGHVCRWQKFKCLKPPCPRGGRYKCFPICEMPKSRGPCRCIFKRYYYDKKLRRCVFFIYGGCCGNENNFKTKAECERICRPKNVCTLKCKAGYVCKWQNIACITTPCPPGRYKCVAICKMPKVVGPCEARFSRYYYNVRTGSCQRFFYGGCLGNENNFKTKAACEKLCRPKTVCPLKCKVGYVCKLLKILCKKWPCPPWRYKCVAICKLRKVVGRCMARLSRYYYNARTGSCQRFFYGGCGGNENNFKTKAACEKLCRPKTAICKLPKVVGRCKARLSRYYYNVRTGSCQRFFYGGCLGNRNNFKTKAACEKLCRPKKAICKLPKVVGRCMARFSRYYYNVRTRSCQRFFYGGCGGNRNNFKTKAACEKICSK